MVLAVCFHLFIEESSNTAVQEPNAATAGVRQRKIMMPTSNGDSVPAVFCVTVVIRMVTAVIFHSYMVGKCTQHAPVKMKPNPGALQHTTMTSTNNGATVEVKSVPSFYKTHHYSVVNFCFVAFTNAK